MYIVEEHMRRRRLIKRISIAIGIVAGIILLGLLIWKFVFADKIKIFRYKTGEVGDTLEDMGTGTGDREDMFYIVRSDVSTTEELIPGEFILDVESDEIVVKMSDTVEREEFTRMKSFYSYVNIRAFNVRDGSSEKYMDILEEVEDKCPGYQYVGWLSSVLGEDGNIYIGFQVESIPQKATDEAIWKWIVWNTETEKSMILDYEEGCQWFAPEPDEQKADYWEDMDAVDWDSFYAENGYTEDDFSLDSIASSEGGVFVEVNCENFPQENEMLYDRFPELEKWKGESGKTAKILIGGFPTAEEVMEMFAENAG